MTQTTDDLVMESRYAKAGFGWGRGWGTTVGLLIAGCGAPGLMESEAAAVPVVTVDPSTGGEQQAVPTTTAPAAPTGPASDPALLARLAAAKADDTSSSVTPMGRQFATAAASPTNANQRAALGSGTLLPTIPSSMGGVTWHPFAVTLFGPNGPVPSDVHQHGVGDCDGVALMAGIAFQNPGFLRAAITPLSASTFQVRLYDPQGQPVMVVVNNSFLTGSDGSLVQTSGADGTANWATVLEKATMVYNQVFQVFNDTTTPGGTGGIGSEHQGPILTGNGTSFAFFRQALSASDLKAAVFLAMQAGQLVTGGFGQDTSLHGLNVFASHGYSVFGVGDQNSLIMQMRNPWGCAPITSTGVCDSNNDGVVSVALDDSVVPAIDLRVINPGAAQASGNTALYR